MAEYKTKKEKNPCKLNFNSFRSLWEKVTITEKLKRSVFPQKCGKIIKDAEKHGPQEELLYYTHSGFFTVTCRGPVAFFRKSFQMF